MWAEQVTDAGAVLVHPEIADYEVRRELLRAGRTRGIARLDELGRVLEYLPLTTPMVRVAAHLWAEARNAGHPTADDRSLDADVLLAAQALALAENASVIVATTNTRHLERYVPAGIWHEIA